VPNHTTVFMFYAAWPNHFLEHSSNPHNIIGPVPV